ncbi:iron-binding protein [bacterium]|nr:iron-binding protein [bacterium]
MSDDIYTGKMMDRRYVGEHVDILYSAKRCIHAEECIHRLAAVFDAKRRPWILPGATPAETVAEVVAHCPSGALHYESKDGAVDIRETPPPTNEITLWHNGPLQFSGELHITGANVQINDETRVTLCRCGQSQSKPFCDNSHKTSGFDGTVTAPLTALPTRDGGPLKISVSPNGPLVLEGAFSAAG